MRSKVKLKKIGIMVALCMCIIAAPILFSGCPSVSTGTLYLTSSLTGKVYTFDFATNTCSTDPLFDYGTDAGDGVFFFYDKGYIASASFTDPKLITFNPGASTITPSTISHTWVAGPWDILAVNRSKIYVSDIGNYGQNDGGVYYFNPTESEPAFTKITGSDANSQDMVYLATKKKIYVANSGSDTVSVIDTAADAETKEIDVETNPTNIVALSDESRIYVICSNFFGKSKLVEIITDSDTLGETFTIADTAQAPTLYGTRIYYTGVQDPFGAIIDIGPFYIDVSESIPTETLIPTTKAGGANSLIYNGKIYITQPDWGGGQSTMTVINLSDHSEISGSPFNIGNAGDGIKGMAVY